MRRLGRVLLAVAVGGLLVAAAYVGSQWGTIADAGKPREAWERDRLCYTLLVMIGVDEAIRQFQEANGRLPQSLVEMDVKARPPKDAWGNTIIFEPTAGGGFRLVAPGPDQIAGTNDDESKAEYESVTARYKHLCSPESRWAG